MATLPPGVTLHQIDGGATYYADNGFTYAVNMGWDDPNFFSIGIFNGTMRAQSDAARWADLGLNTMVGLGQNPIQSSDYTLMQNNGISYITAGPSDQTAASLSSSAPFWVGNITADEPVTFAGGVSTPISTSSNASQDHRFLYMNNNWYFVTPQLGGLAPVESSVDVLDSLVATPNGTQRHIDISSTDMYWFAGANGNVPWVVGAGGDLYDLGRSMTPDEAARGSNYGDMVDSMRSVQAGDFPAPIPQYIETGGPYTEDTTGTSYITPPELNWAVWSSLIHGARQIIYFNHSFGGPAAPEGTNTDNLADAYFHTVQPGQTISIYDQVEATDAMVEQMAPVLNSPFAFGYVHVNGGYNDLTPDHTLGGIETAAHYSNGTFYIFADTRDSESQHNIPATFILNDPSAISVAVVNEDRTIPVVNESFSDTFASASTVHIYQVNDGPGAPPPPGAPPALSATQLAVAVEATMYNATGTAAEIISLSANFLPPQIANATQLGLNAQVYACEALGLVFAFGNETGSTAFANNFGPSNNAMPNTAAGDAAFAAAACGTIFDGASTANLVSVMDTFVTNWKAFYTSHGIPGNATPTAGQVDLASRGAAWGDMVGIALVNDIGPLSAQVMNFVDDIAQGTAIYGASLVGQPIHQPFV